MNILVFVSHLSYLADSAVGAGKGAVDATCTMNRLCSSETAHKVEGWPWLAAH